MTGPGRKNAAFVEAETRMEAFTPRSPDRWEGTDDPNDTVLEG